MRTRRGRGRGLSWNATLQHSRNTRQLLRAGVQATVMRCSTAALVLHKQAFLWQPSCSLDLTRRVDDCGTRYGATYVRTDATTRRVLISTSSSTCFHPVHQGCWEGHKAAQAGGSVSCPVCRHEIVVATAPAINLQS